MQSAFLAWRVYWVATGERFTNEWTIDTVKALERWTMAIGDGKD